MHYDFLDRVDSGLDCGCGNGMLYDPCDITLHIANLFQTAVQLADVVSRRLEELCRHEDDSVVHEAAGKEMHCKEYNSFSLELQNSTK